MSRTLLLIDDTFLADASSNSGVADLSTFTRGAEFRTVAVSKCFIESLIFILLNIHERWP